MVNFGFIEAIEALGLAPLFKLLEDLGLPSIPAAFSKETTNYIEQLAKVKRILGRDIFFGLDVIPDPRNTSNNIMLLDTPITSSPLPKYSPHPSHQTSSTTFLLMFLQFRSDKELEKRLHAVRSRFRKLKDEPDEPEDPEDPEDEVPSVLKKAELAYMSDVIKQILNNGTLDSCSLSEDTFPEEGDLETVVDMLYEMTTDFYYVSPP